MIEKIVHFSDLHVRLFKDHDLYRSILEEMFQQWREIAPDRIVFTGDLVHSKNQMTPELINFVAWTYSLTEHNIKPEIEKNDKFKIGLFHGPIVGLKTDIGYTFEDGYDTDRFAGCDIVLCGDIHKRQVFDIPGGKSAYMVGSTIQQNFGETIRKHGYGIYNLKTDDYQFVDLPNPKPFLKFKISDITDLENGTEQLLNY